MTRGDRGISAALRALKQRPGPPTEHDRPRPSVFPGKKVKLIPGQLDLAGNQHGEQPSLEQDDKSA